MTANGRVVPGLMLTVSETARALRVSPTTVKKLIHDEKLISVRIGRSRRVREADLRAYVNDLDGGQQ